MFLTSKLITCISDHFTLKRKSQSIAYLLNRSEHIYWILNLTLKMKCTQYGLYEQAAFKNARVRPEPGLGQIQDGPRSGLGQIRGRPSLSFFGVAPAHHPDERKAHKGYLE